MWINHKSPRLGGCAGIRLSAGNGLTAATGLNAVPWVECRNGAKMSGQAQFGDIVSAPLPACAAVASGTSACIRSGEFTSPNGGVKSRLQTDTPPSCGLPSRALPVGDDFSQSVTSLRALSTPHGVFLSLGTISRHFARHCTPATISRSQSGSDQSQPGFLGTRPTSHAS